jgi:hypothetical protein
MSPTTAQSMRAYFLGWQCRIRQIAMRQDGGRPSPGMRPRVLDAAGAEIAPSLTVLLTPEEPAESTAFFRFQVLKSPDPRDLYERGLAYLRADHYQRPETFTDTLVAVLPENSVVAGRLLAEGNCTLAFDQFRQTFRLPCKVRDLQPGDDIYDAAVWHNRLFNPALPGALHVIAFKPDWASAEAEPGPGARSASRSGPSG